jgi:hypothetical protein
MVLGRPRLTAAWVHQRVDADGHQVVYVTEEEPSGLAAVNHGFHLLLTCLTCGCWLPVWLLICVLSAIA